MREEQRYQPGQEPLPSAPDIKASGGGALLRVRVQPRSSGNALAGVHASALKVKVTPPAEGGRANAACMKLLSRALSVPRSALSVARGGKERDKIIMVSGLSREEVRRKLGPFLAEL